MAEMIADRGLGLDLDLDGRAEEAGAKDRPADSGPVEYEVPGKQTRVRIGMNG
jgi:hypothetical protein